MEKHFITIVSGLPRSGTSMMMMMLEAGGLPVMTDNLRTADEDNPRGYYEFERVKQIAHDHAWLPEAQGKVVKMISELLKHLSPNYSYKVIFMRRKIEETLASQRQMLVRRGQATETIGDDQMAELFREHLSRLEAWFGEQPNFEMLYVDYSAVLENPRPQAVKINAFLNNALDVEKMVNVVDQKLYRQRR